MDHAMRCVVELLVNCRTTGVQQIHDTKSKERSDRVTVDQRVDQQPRHAVRVINHLDSRRVENTADLPWRKFPSPEFRKKLQRKVRSFLILILTRSSAIAEGPRDASRQLKSCQLPRNSAETTYTTSPDQIDGMKLEI